MDPDIETVYAICPGCEFVYRTPQALFDAYIASIAAFGTDDEDPPTRGEDVEWCPLCGEDL